jgi:type I restriction enzyme M protein
VNCYFGRGDSPNRPRAVEVNRPYLSRHERKQSERFKGFTYEELSKRDKLNLDIFWLKDESLEDSANLPHPDVIAAEIVEDLQAALSEFAEIANDLKK